MTYRYLTAPILACWLVAISISAFGADLQWTVYDKKTDKKLMSFDGRGVENANGKRILSCDGKSIEDANGKTVLSFDFDTSQGFSIRDPKDSHVRLLWTNGHQLSKKVDGKVVFEYDGREQNIYLNGSNRAIYTLTCHNGNLDSRLEAWQVVAIGYVLQKSLFTVSKEDVDAQRAEAEMAAKETEQFFANRLLGDFTVVTSSSKALKEAKLLVKPIGKFVYMNYELKSGTKLQGIGIHMQPGGGNSEEQILTALNADGAVAVGIYEIGSGTLKGSWYPTSLLANPKSSIGIENLQGKTGDDLSGEFQITEAKTPDKGEAYSGTLEVVRFQRSDASSTPSYQLTWNLGSAKMMGVGVQVELFDSKSETRKKYLVAAVGSGDVLVGQHFCTTSSDVHLDFATLGKSFVDDGNNGGYIMLTK
jgi:hypothetical protein